eukprot:6167828-Pyramimonas_sp.AAC.2
MAQQQRLLRKARAEEERRRVQEAEQARVAAEQAKLQREKAEVERQKAEVAAALLRAKEAEAAAKKAEEASKLAPAGAAPVRATFPIIILLDFTGPPVPITARMHSTTQGWFVGLLLLSWDPIIITLF